MPGGDGLQAAAALHDAHPEVKILFLTTFGRPGFLHLPQGTVRNHLSVVIQKLGARNRVDAVRIALEKGWLPPR